jgi:hypothetical protein
MQRHRNSESVYLAGRINPDRSPGLQMRYARSGDNQTELMEISAIAQLTRTKFPSPCISS